ncbi:hypothetical protein BT63DRAFT_193638 [Microthyrium microscopicum]|uniref:Uncharacterized protein n=1 Tax=Microthyrium microscopicum TaxID=703497 RepID=A0A6A6ULJ8_9PEZI|nr:hypothetical protein BT63DRAFT_193638 [Microthyrium microscopicum]
MGEQPSKMPPPNFDPTNPQIPGVSSTYSALDLDDATVTEGLRSILKGSTLETVSEQRDVRIGIGAVSSMLAIYVIFRIWRDSWRASQLAPQQPKTGRFAYLWEIHPAETFPLILGFAILGSSLTMIIIEAGALSTIAVENCKDTGIIGVPIVLTFAFLHFVFGLETTIRYLRRNTPISQRYRFSIPVNLAAFGVLELITLIVAKEVGDDADKCFGNIVTRAASLDLNRGIIGVLGIVMISLLTMATIIALQLLRTIHLDPAERIAGSRMVYYLVATTVLEAFIIPFFVQDYLGTLDDDFTSATIAEYVLFSSGAVLTFLHLFLRANAAMTAIKARETTWHTPRRLRFWGPNDLEVMNISPPLNLVNPSFRPDEKIDELCHKTQRGSPPTPKTPLTNFSYPQKSLLSKSSSLKLRRIDTENDLPPLPPTPISQQSSPVAQMKSPVAQIRSPSSQINSNHARKKSYVLFPGEDDIKLPATVYSPPSLTSRTNPFRPVLKVQTGPQTQPIQGPFTAPSGILGGPLTAPSVTDIRQATLEANGGLQPPGAPWMLHRRGSSTDSTATVQIGIRLSNAGSGVFQRSQSFLPLPRMGEMPESRPGSRLRNPFDNDFSNGFQAQVRDATGRDLNSFQWIDTPSDESPPAVDNGLLLLQPTTYTPPLAAARRRPALVQGSIITSTSASFGNTAPETESRDRR